jgi:hypothetical protein
LNTKKQFIASTWEGFERIDLIFYDLETFKDWLNKMQNHIEEQELKSLENRAIIHFSEQD